MLNVIKSGSISTLKYASKNKEAELSELAKSFFKDIDFSKYRSFLMTGTAFAVEPSRTTAFKISEKAKKNEIPIFLDLDFRANLWNNILDFGSVLKNYLKLTDIIIGTEEEVLSLNLTDTEQVKIKNDSITQPKIVGNINDAIKLENETINVLGSNIKIGKSSIKTFLVVRDLICRFVLCDKNESEEDFLLGVKKELFSHGVLIKKAICGKAKSLTINGEDRFTRSLMIADLSKENSVLLQDAGLGDGRIYGCGIFLPHKSVDAVSGFKED